MTPSSFIRMPGAWMRPLFLAFAAALCLLAPRTAAAQICPVSTTESTLAADSTVKDTAARGKSGQSRRGGAPRRRRKPPEGTIEAAAVPSCGGDGSAPTVSVSPAGGTFGPSVALTVTWSDDEGLDVYAYVFSLNGMDVTPQFTASVNASSGYATGTVTLPPGTNSFRAEVWDQAGNYAWASETYTYTPPPPAPDPPAVPPAHAHLPSRTGDPAQTAAGVVHPGTAVRRDLCVAMAVGAGAAYECADLRLVHALPSVRVLNTPRTPVLLYNSQHAQPRPIIPFNLQMTAGNVPTSVTAILRVGTIGGPQVERARQTWTGSWQAGGLWRFALSYDASEDDSDVYAYSVEVLGTFGGVQSPMPSHSGELAVVNRSRGPAGPSLGGGWGVAGVEQRIWLRDGARALVIGGDGSTRVYRWVATNTSVSENVDRPDTLHGVYVDGQLHSFRRLPNGSQVWYDAAGRHYKTVTRLGHATWFTYDFAGRLQQVILPVPATSSSSAVYVFGYANANGGRLDWICAIVSGTSCRNTIVHHEHNDHRITGITDLDSTLATFGYEGASGRVRTLQRTQVSAVASFSYDAAGKLTQASIPVPDAGHVIRHGFTPGESRGLLTAVAAASAVTTYDGPRTGVADQTNIWLNRWGAPTRVRDPLGNNTYLTRSDSRFPALVTRVDYPGGRHVSAEYDARGNLKAQTDWSTSRTLPNGTTAFATSRYERANATWPDFVTQATSPEGEVSRTDYQSNGNVAWQQPGVNALRRVTYGYNAAGQVETVLQPGATRATVLHYDPNLGNLAKVVTPMGIETRYLSDALGRDTLVDAPVDGYRRLKTITRYDVMGFDTLSISDGDALEGDLYVRTERNRQGQPLLVERWSTVDSIEVGTVRRSWQYDAVGRLAVEVDEAGEPLRHYYDAAGNDTLTISRRGYLLRTRHDVLNRPVERITPSVTYDRWIRGIAGIRARSGQVSEDTFPYYPITAPDSTFVIPGDTVKFAYDPVTGQMTRADNRYAQIRRGYNQNGTLRVDTTRVRTWDMLAWSASPHVYVQQYEYDLNGRRTRLTLPDNLAPEPGRQHQDYTYDPVWGGLRQVRSAMGLEYGFTYNREGAADSIRYPGNRVETFFYDLDGRRTRRRMAQGSYVIGDATFTLNENGSNDAVVERGTLAEYINEVRYDYMYTQLGRLRQAKTKRIASGRPLGPQRLEDYSWDALGNRWKSHVHGDVGSGTHPTISWYRSGTNRVTLSTPPPGTTDERINFNQSSYDDAGNVDWFGGTTYTSGNQAIHIDESVTRSYYSADEKLHAAETRRCMSEVPLNNGTDPIDPDPPFCNAPYTLSNANSGSFEWYRYDALGRRIMVRTRRDPWCGGAGCSSTITRFIWDGDQVLAEIQGEGGAYFSETPNQTGPQYGRVVYTHGGGLDQPLDIMRSSGAGGATGILLPIPTWRGTFVTATDPAGNMVCAPWVYCEITFTRAHSSAFLLPGVPVAGSYWYGSLAQGNEDASGTIYMRNRYYNPQTGSFTQQDPIGLAGGLNTYGFANGDPVSYADPYGLRVVFRGDVAEGRRLWRELRDNARQATRSEDEETRKAGRSTLSRMRDIERSRNVLRINVPRGGDPELGQCCGGGATYELPIASALLPGKHFQVDIDPGHIGARWGMRAAVGLAHELGHAWGLMVGEERSMIHWAGIDGENDARLIFGCRNIRHSEFEDPGRCE